MKKHSKIIMLLLVLIVAALSTFPLATETQAATPKISRTKAILTKGKQLKLKVTGTKKKPKWSSSKNKVVTVTSKGVVTAKNKGTANIIAKVGNKKLTCVVTVENPRLNSKQISVNNGTLFYLRVYDTRRTVKWSTTDNAVATVAQYRTEKDIAMVKAVGPGTCRIYARVGGKRLSCSVMVRGTQIPNPTSAPTIIPNPTVTPGGGFSESDAKNNLAYESHRTNNGVIVIVKNNYRFNTHLKMDVLYYNSSGTMIGKASDYCYVLEPGRETVLHAINPYDSSYNKVDYSRYEVVFACEEARAIGNANNISCEANFGSGNVMATVKNLGGYAEFTSIGVVFYKDGGIIGYEEHFADVKKSGASDYLQFDFPYDSEYNTITPDNFRIFVNYSYRYNF